jgi:hypothetical protein
MFAQSEWRQGTETSSIVMQIRDGRWFNRNIAKRDPYLIRNETFCEAITYIIISIIVMYFIIVGARGNVVG